MFFLLRKLKLPLWLSLIFIVSLIATLAWSQVSQNRIPLDLPITNDNPSEQSSNSRRTSKDTHWRPPSGDLGEITDTAKQEPIAKLGMPLQSAIPQDALQSLTPPASLKGTLTYCVAADRINAPPPAGDFLVLRHIGNGISTVTTYPLQIGRNQYLMDPKFYKRGQSVLFKVGWPFDRYGEFDLYTLDLKAQNLQKLTKEPLVNENIQISPDGNYLAYIRGGDRFGNPTPGMDFGPPTEVLRLCVLDVGTGQEHTIVSNNTISSGGYSWTPNSTLMYSVLPPQTALGLKSGDNTKSKRPNLYEVAAAGGKAQLKISDAWRPLCSPDGQWIAFFGSEDPIKPVPLGTNWQDDPNGASLCVVQGNGQGRRAINRETGNYPHILWERDSQHLIVMKTLQTGSQSTASIQMVDTATDQFKTVSKLNSKDSQSLPRPVSMVPPFIPINTSNDGQFFFANTEEYGDQDPVSKMFNRYYTFSAIDDRNGTISAVCKLKNAYGLDWYDESSLTFTPKSKPN